MNQLGKLITRINFDPYLRHKTGCSKGADFLLIPATYSSIHGNGIITIGDMTFMFDKEKFYLGSYSEYHERSHSHMAVISNTAFDRYRGIVIEISDHLTTHYKLNVRYENCVFEDAESTKHNIPSGNYENCIIG